MKEYCIKGNQVSLHSLMHYMQSSLLMVCSMVSSFILQMCHVLELNPYLRELDDYLPKFLSGELSVEDQVVFIQTVIDLDLQDRYSLHQECKYFILEGFCYEVFLGDD
jgi:hypothetical protein